MSVNVPYKIRVALYAATALCTPAVAYLQAKGVIGPLEITLWSAEVTAVGALAALNVTRD